LGDCSGGYAGGRFARRGPLQYVTRIGEIVLQCACQVGVTGARRRYRLVLRRIAYLYGQGLSPVLPVAILNLDGDRRSDGLAVTHAGEEGRIALLDAHPASAAVALLPAPQLAVYARAVDRHPGGHTRNQ